MEYGSGRPTGELELPQNCKKKKKRTKLHNNGASPPGHSELEHPWPAPPLPPAEYPLASLP